jgi:hypothetical protein
MDFTIDLLPMLKDFGVDATLGAVAVRGIEDRTPGIAQGVIGGVDPTFQLPTSSVAGDPRGLALVITGGNSYTVRDYSTDGDGVTLLQLEAV